MRIGSLFSGAGGLDMAIERVFGATTAWHCELDPAASKVLAAHWPGVPNLGDITAIDWAAVEPVDILCGGFPCQDVSSAGRRAGLQDGTRTGLWARFADAIEALRPRYVIAENVRGLLSATAHRPMESEPDGLGDRDAQPVLRAIGAVLGDLSDLGYDAQWATVSAASVGAPHRRERVFILAADTERDRSRREADDARGWQSDTAGRDVRVQSDRCCAAAPLTPRNGRHEGRPESARLVGGSDAAERGHGAVDQSGNTPENHLAKKPGRTVVTDLAILVQNGPLETGGRPAMLPTPTSRDYKGGNATVPDGAGGRRPVELSDTTKSRGDGGASDLASVACLLPTPGAADGNGGQQRSQAALDGDHGKRQRDLPNIARLLPTPTASDGAGGKTSRSGDRIDEMLIGGLVRAHADGSLLPTPTTQDGANCADPSQFERNSLPLNVVATLLPSPSASDGIGGGPNNPNNRLAQGHQVQLLDLGMASADQWGKYAPAIARWEAVTRPAPAPTEPNKNGNPRLSAAFSEWLMGWPAGWVTDVPGISRNDALRIVGNGVVDRCAEAALRYLLSVAREVVA